jgi:hypothetical protein
MFSFNSKFYFDNGLKISVPKDLIDYYRKLLTYATYNTQKFNYPKYRPHISVILPKIHGVTNVEKSKKYIGKLATVEYDPEKFIHSRVNHYVPVICQEAEEVKRELGIFEKPHFLGLHITIANMKNLD